MEVKIKQLTEWADVKSAALATVGKKYTGKEITDKWKKQILLAEHSPIRTLIFEIELIGIPYYVSTHLVRHKLGVEHYVTTQRTDRTGVNREELPQGALVNHKMIINAQALINISRKRLCSMADIETQKVWRAVKDAVNVIEPIIASVMVSECIYRNFCPEMSSCGFTESSQDMFELCVDVYRSIVV